jgi:hypothetical protein
MASRKKPNKSEFVRSQGDAKASDVVAAAKKKGITLTERYVYVIRSADKAKARGNGLVVGRGRGRGRASGDAEARLRHAIAELGLAAARRVLQEVESAFR